MHETGVRDWGLHLGSKWRLRWGPFLACLDLFEEEEEEEEEQGSSLVCQGPFEAV